MVQIPYGVLVFGRWVHAVMYSWIEYRTVEVMCSLRRPRWWSAREMLVLMWGGISTSKNKILIKLGRIRTFENYLKNNYATQRASPGQHNLQNQIAVAKKSGYIGISLKGKSVLRFLFSFRGTGMYLYLAIKSQETGCHVKGDHVNYHFLVS